ncbi:MAG: CBS domain-containing protein, partial [Candidatus Heimdallarchaeota archaeon]|nr:CBS domain-containing protein [Candidatus Heimdallarchaeota archaeon]
LFNMLPAFPMDGGRVLRGFLGMRMEYTRATQIAANIGQAMALLFGLIGFFTNPFLIFIALFVWIGASQEASMVKVNSALEGIPVRSAMITDFQTLHSSETLARAIELILAGSQQDFPVFENDKVVGVLTRERLMSALAEHGQDYSVGQAMERDFQVTDSSEMLQSAMNRLQGINCKTMLVLNNGQLLGILNKENIGEFMMIHSALKKSNR